MSAAAGEEEVVRVQLASITSDVISVRVRVAGGLPPPGEGTFDLIVANITLKCCSAPTRAAKGGRGAGKQPSGW